MKIKLSSVIATGVLCLTMANAAVAEDAKRQERTVVMSQPVSNEHDAKNLENVKSGVYKELLGKYGERKSLVLEGNELKIYGLAGIPLALAPTADDMFVVTMAGLKLRINRTDKGKVESISISLPQPGKWKTYPKA